MKIGIIICYFGEWPGYFPYFLTSIAQNKSFHWLIFSDNYYNFPKYNNINYHKIDLSEFNKLTSYKTNIKIQIDKAYKLCDIRPLFGKIFEDQLSGFDYWGYSDIDIIYGQISDFINEETLNNFDVISSYPGFLSGPLCLYRNKKDINLLAEQSVNYHAVLKSPQHFGFDENIKRDNIHGFSLKKLISFIGFLIGTNTRDTSWKNLRYQFQWYYKKKTIDPGNLVDMTEVVMYNDKISTLKAHFKALIRSERAFKRLNKKHWKLEWYSGRLVNKMSGEALMAFHFIDLKNDNIRVMANKYKPGDKFSITDNGINNE